MILRLSVLCTITTLTLVHDVGTVVANARRGRDDGQSTAEYALVLLGAVGVALLFVAWAAKSSRVGKLLDAVWDAVIKQVK